MTRKHKKMVKIAYLTQLIVTLSIIFSSMYVVNNSDYPELNTENMKIFLAFFNCLLILQLLQGTLKFNDVYKTKIDEDVKNEIGLSEQIGYLVGDNLVYNFLPTLSTDGITLNDNAIIKVSDELTKIWREKDDEWFKICDTEKGTKLFYENLAWYKENIENIYLESELKIFIRDLDTIGDKEEFLSGVNGSLWDCDASHYTATDVVLECGEFYRYYYIILKKDE